jgi:pimeloyl-ACP methyl ester carboxylesterase
MRIHERGDPSRSALVLLHGLASSPRCWERNLDALEPGRRLVLVDLFARGARRFSLRETADALARELTERGMLAADIVAHSMGGLVALHLTAMAPELVSRLVLVDVPAMQLPRRPLARVGAVARSSVRPHATAIGLIMGCVLRTSPLTLLTAARATATADLFQEAGQAAVPTLVVWGADDLIVPLEVGQRLATCMPAAQLCVVPGVGHQPMWEAPRVFNQVVAAFLTIGSA